LNKLEQEKVVMNRILRKQYIVNKDFQARLTMIIILLVIIVANIMGGLVYFMLNTDTGLAGMVSVLNVSSTEKLLFPAILTAEIISILIVALISLFVSHRMAGPVYRFERVIEDMRDGNLDFTFKIREKDEFKELADSLGELISEYNQVIGQTKKSTKYLEETLKELNRAVQDKKRSKSDNSVKLSALAEKIENQKDEIVGLLDFFKTKN
jgi:methyl-accepting chemotaxis protein